MDVFNTTLVAVADTVVTSTAKCFPLGTILSLLFGWAVDDNDTEFEPNTLCILTTTAWSAHTIQIWDSHFERWETAQSSAHAVAQAKGARWVYNLALGYSEWNEGNEYRCTIYSPMYGNISQRKEAAVNAYNGGRVSYDHTGDIDFSLEMRRVRSFTILKESLCLHTKRDGLSHYTTNRREAFL